MFFKSFKSDKIFDVRKVRFIAIISADVANKCFFFTTIIVECCFISEMSRSEPNRKYRLTKLYKTCASNFISVF